MARFNWRGGNSSALDLIRSSGGVTRQKTSGLQNPANWFFDAITEGSETIAGVPVGPITAASHADVYACIRVLADAVASTPLLSYRKTPGGRERVENTPTAVLLHRPHPLITQASLFSLVLAHLNLHGESFLAKLRPATRGPVTRLWPLNPQAIDVGVADGEPVYQVRKSDWVEGGVFSRRDILHIKGMSLDGIRGVSPIAQARLAIGMGIAMEQYGAKYFANSAYPGGVIQMPGTLTDDAAARLKRDWESFHKGLSNAQRVAVLEGGAEFQAISIPPEDAQFIEQRRYSATQMARIFRVPPWMIGADAGTSMTYSNIEQSMLQFATYSVRPWLAYIEQAFAADEDLYPVGLPDDPYPEFLMDSLLRADTATRYEAYSKAHNKWLTTNEIRRFDNLPDLPGGDELQAPAAPPVPRPPAMDDDGAINNEGRTVILMPERDERIMKRALELAADSHRTSLREIMGELRASDDGPGLIPVVNVNVSPTPITVQVPDPVVNVQVPPAVVEVIMPPEPKEGPKTITIQRDVAGRMKGATVEES